MRHSWTTLVIVGMLFCAFALGCGLDACGEQHVADADGACTSPCCQLLTIQGSGAHLSGLPLFAEKVSPASASLMPSYLVESPFRPPEAS